MILYRQTIEGLDKMKQGNRILSIEAADIYRQDQENGVSVGYKMPKSKSDAYFRLFKYILTIRLT